MTPRKVPVNWDDLEMALTTNAGEWSCYLDVRTGDHRVRDPALSRHCRAAMTVRPRRRKSSSNAKQGMRSSSVVTTTNEIASQNERR